MNSIFQLMSISGEGLWIQWGIILIVIGVLFFIILLYSKLKQIKVQILLSRFNYNTSGIRFRWNQIWVMIPSDQLPLKIKNGHLLEEFKTDLQGEIIIYLYCHRINHKIEKTEVRIDKRVVDNFVEFTSRIEHLVNKIQSLATMESLTLRKAQAVLDNDGFRYDDDKIHRILAEIINNMPLQQIQKKIEVPLSHLQYNTKGINFPYDNVFLDVQKKKLTFEIGSIWERIKSSVEGIITFYVNVSHLQRWDNKVGQLLVGTVTKDVTKAEINPDTLDAFKQLRCEMICGSIGSLINRSSVSPDKVEPILEEWDLDLNNQEIGEKIVDTIPPWTEENVFQVPLNEITYRDSDIMISLNGENVFIVAEQLPFETSTVLENIKEVFESNIKVRVSQSVQFKWSQAKKQLTINRQKYVIKKIEVEDETIQKFKKIIVLYKKLLEKGIDPITAIGDLEKLEINKVPEDDILKKKGYDVECVRFLEKITDHIYMTSKDLWFHIKEKDKLIWERPEIGAATYIFNWPKEELKDFIGRVWGLELKYIRGNLEDSYIGRVIHNPDERSRWETNLITKIK